MMRPINDNSSKDAIMQSGTVTYLDTAGDELCHNLWSTPVIISRPFTPEQIAQMKEDVKPLLEPGAPGTLNKTNIWDLPDLPESLRLIERKLVELADKYYRPMAEMPLPPLRCSKGYFREIKQDSIYRISPHKHAQTLAAGIFYLDIPERNAGNLMIMDPRAGVLWHNQFTPFKRIRIEEGMMVIHPGYLLHFVEPTDYDNARFDYRLAVVSNVHWQHADFIKELEKNEEKVFKMGSIEV
jgi:hypothetical protein